MNRRSQNGEEREEARSECCCQLGQGVPLFQTYLFFLVTSFRAEVYLKIRKGVKGEEREAALVNGGKSFYRHRCSVRPPPRGLIKTYELAKKRKKNREGGNHQGYVKDVSQHKIPGIITLNQEPARKVTRGKEGRPSYN